MSDVSRLADRVEALESQVAIRAVVARYFALCETLGPDTDGEDIGALFTRDAVWRGKGNRYATAFGEHHGRAAIVGMICKHCDPPHFAMNAHFFSGETIAVDGETAQGRWMMLQTSTYPTGASDLRSARLAIGFAREDGAWRIAHFETENIFSRQIDHWDFSDPVPVPELD